MVECFQSRAEDYIQTVKVAMEFDMPGRSVIDAVSAEWRCNLFAAYSIPAPARTAEELTYALHYLDRKRLFAPNTNYGCLLKYAATLTTLIALAVKMGYHKIILCGIDLRDQRYFFQDRELYPKTAGIQLLPKNQPHGTNIALEWRLPIVRTTEILRDVLLRPAGIEIYVENPKSALYPSIPEAPTDLFSGTVSASLRP